MSVRVALRYRPFSLWFRVRGIVYVITNKILRPLLGIRLFAASRRGFEIERQATPFTILGTSFRVNGRTTCTLIALEATWKPISKFPSQVSSNPSRLLFILLSSCPGHSL